MDCRLSAAKPGLWTGVVWQLMQARVLLGHLRYLADP